jgi:hypothetical protein
MAEIKFTPPAGFKTPNGTKEGEEFDTLATLRMEGSELCLVAIDGVELTEEETSEPEEDSDDWVGGVEKGLATAAK